VPTSAVYKNNYIANIFVKYLIPTDYLYSSICSHNILYDKPCSRVRIYEYLIRQLYVLYIQICGCGIILNVILLFREITVTTIFFCIVDTVPNPWAEPCYMCTSKFYITASSEKIITPAYHVIIL